MCHRRRRRLRRGRGLQSCVLLIRDVHHLNGHRVVFLLFDVVLEMIFVFMECSCRLFAVVAVVRSSGTVVA